MCRSYVSRFSIALSALTCGCWLFQGSSPTATPPTMSSPEPADSAPKDRPGQPVLSANVIGDTLDINLQDTRECSVDGKWQPCGEAEPSVSAKVTVVVDEVARTEGATAEDGRAIILLAMEETKIPPVLPQKVEVSVLTTSGKSVDTSVDLSSFQSFQQWKAASDAARTAIRKEITTLAKACNSGKGAYDDCQKMLGLQLDIGKRVTFEDLQLEPGKYDKKIVVLTNAVIVPYDSGSDVFYIWHSAMNLFDLDQAMDGSYSKYAPKETRLAIREMGSQRRYKGIRGTFSSGGNGGTFVLFDLVGDLGSPTASR